MTAALGEARAPAMTSLPRLLSTKRRSSRRSTQGLAPNRLLDDATVYSVVGSELFRQITGGKAVSEDCSWYSSSRDHQAAEGDSRIEHDEPRVVDLYAAVSTRPGEGKEPLSKTLGVEIQPPQVSAKHFAHSQLACLRYVEQLAEVVHEQTHAVRLEDLAYQRTFDLQVSFHVPERLSNLGQSVVLANGVQDVRFDQVEERKRRRRSPGDDEDGLERSRPEEPGAGWSGGGASTPPSPTRSSWAGHADLSQRIE